MVHLDLLVTERIEISWFHSNKFRAQFDDVV